MSLATYKHCRTRGLASWNPQAKTVALLEDVKDVLEEYVDHLPLTARQVFYRLVGKRGYEKSENAYARLLEALNRARRSGRIFWGAIRDDGGIVKRPFEFYDIPNFWGSVEKWAKKYHVYRQDGQKVVLELWCEAGGMVPQLAAVAHPFGVTVYSSGGFDSTTSKYEAAQRYVSRDRPTLVLHVGDFDPSGLSVFDSASEDIMLMVEDLGKPEHISFERVAVTPPQIDRFSLPGAPAKKTDRRGNWEGDTVQAEALDPATLADEVRFAIQAHVDLDVRKKMLAREKKERKELVAQVKKIRKELND